MALGQNEVPPVCTIAIALQLVRILELDEEDRLTLIWVNWELNIGCGTCY